MDYKKTYTTYKRPPLSPPPYLFGIVWSILYILIIISYGFVFYQTFLGNISVLIASIFVINLIANGLFTYFQFKLKNNLFATIDIIVVLATIIITLILMWTNFRWIAYLQIPYLSWVTFATYLQFSVTILNRK